MRTKAATPSRLLRIAGSISMNARRKNAPPRDPSPWLKYIRAVAMHWSTSWVTGKSHSLAPTGSVRRWRMARAPPFSLLSSLS